MKNFLDYQWQVLCQAAKSWKEFVWADVVRGLALAFAVIVTGLWLRPTILERWPSLETSWEGAMGSIAEFLVGCIPVLAIIGASFLVFLLFAPYQLHRANTKALTKTQKKLKEATEALEGQKPQLFGHIQMFFSATRSTEPENTILGAYIVVRNTGEPSIVVGWRCDLICGSGECIPASIFVIKPDDPIVFHGDNNTTKTITADNLIVTKTHVPIPKGGAAFGYLLATVESYRLTEDDNEKARIVISFKDIYERDHTCEMQFGGTRLDMDPEHEFMLQGEVIAFAPPVPPNPGSPKPDQIDRSPSPESGT